MHSIDMLAPKTEENEESKEVTKDNDIDMSEITASFKEIVENQKEVNEQLVNSLNEVTNKLTSKESEDNENE